MFKKSFLSLAIIALVSLAACSVSKQGGFPANSSLKRTIDSSLADAVLQYKHLSRNLPADKFPKTFYANTNTYEHSNSEWWCSGFYPGTLWCLYESTGDAFVRAEAERILKVLEKEKHNTTTHDLGFMMFCSFGNANRLASKTGYKEILITSAKSLISRFNTKTGAIKSWDSDSPSDYLVIIDNMMNLELLFWASDVTGDPVYRNVAITHANTTIKNHFRPDFSSYHLVNYNSETGETKGKKTVQGLSDESAWARGQAWGLYGFTVMYRATKDKKYLKQAEGIADLLVNHPNLPDDKIPYWDYNVSDKNALRDASAAAIMTSALLELAKYTEGHKAEKYFSTAERAIATLSTSAYRASVGSNGGFVLKHGVGHMPNKTEIDVPLTYADYYYIEALNRYKALAR